MPMHDKERLFQRLIQLDGRSYATYKELRGTYDFGAFALHIDHVQSDPFAAPSRMRACVPQASAAYPPHTYQNSSRSVALSAYLIDSFAAQARRHTQRSGSGYSGLIEIATPGQLLLERSAMRIDSTGVEARFTVGLPATGRRALGRQAAHLLCELLPEIIENALRYAANDAEEIERYITAGEDADILRTQLRARELVAFVADGSMLPRRSGIDDRPLAGAVPFLSPPSLRVELELPNAGRVSGMGVREGVTLIVGGGFHGKSTLLRALERGIYNHRPDDGRQRVVCEASAVKIRAEDGRSIAGVDISPFINELPMGRDTTCFSSANASGSTSQAAYIAEAMEAGARTLLVDEDTAATNFMIRDERMRQLVSHEPITPLVDRVHALYRERGISTVLAMGGSGDYLDVADCVIAMEDYLPRDVTKRARTIAAAHPTARKAATAHPLAIRERIPQPHSMDARRGKRSLDARTRGDHCVLFGRETIDLNGVEQLVDGGQTRAIARALLYARTHYIDGRRSLADVLDAVERDLAERGLDALDDRCLGDLTHFRRQELAAAINRLRSLQVLQIEA